MKTLILTILTMFVLNSCDKNEESFSPQNINPTLIGEGSLFSTYSNNITSNNLVILNDQDWNNFISNMNNPNNLSMSFTETNIDFNNYMILAVFDEPRPTGGYQISITNIVENSNNIIVDFNLTGSGDLTQMPTHPYYIVKIPKSNKPVIFQ
jgi:hypothetical protein